MTGFRLLRASCLLSLIYPLVFSISTMQLTQSRPAKFSWRSLPWQQLTPWLVPFGLIVVWQFLSQTGLIPTRILPAPTQVVEATIRLTLSGELVRNVGISLYRALAGFLIGGSIGLVLGALNGLSRHAERLLDSSLQMIRNIPHLALIPLVILWFGIGDQARIFLVALGVFFPVYINTFAGIRSIEPNLLEMGQVYGLSPPAAFLADRLARSFAQLAGGSALRARADVADADCGRNNCC